MAVEVTQADIIERDWAIRVNAETIARQKAKIESLKGALRIFLGGDDRFQVMVGGNPIAVEQMLENARALADAGETA